jgi:phosphoribosylaminoimidazolecarboxamide formyltransferase / IMP cyclohydrolase
MNKKITSALISVFDKTGLEPLIELLSKLGVIIYSTGGTQSFIEKLGVKVIPVDQVTGYPEILGGRVKTLHPAIFGGILGRRDNEMDLKEMMEFNVPAIDLVIVDLYPFEETIRTTTDEKLIIEKIDIGGPSMIRAAAKNHNHTVVIAAKNDYEALQQILETQNGETSIEQRRNFAARAFEIVAHYDVIISKYFSPGQPNNFLESIPNSRHLRYGENPHQAAMFYGNEKDLFEQLGGKELSYNNLVDVDAAIQLMDDFDNLQTGDAIFAIIKHTNVCGIAKRGNTLLSWKAALAGDPESAFGGVLICDQEIDKDTANAINEIFFEVLIAPSFSADALIILQAKKNRIMLQSKTPAKKKTALNYKSLLNGVVAQGIDEGNYAEWKECGGRETTSLEKNDLAFANIIAKHLKSNAIALVKNNQLVGKGCGQTSRIDSLRQAVEKAKQFNFSLEGAVMASDAFFPFDDCVRMGHETGITAFIQPGGSIRDKDSIEYCIKNNLAMVITGMRHFKH